MTQEELDALMASSDGIENLEDESLAEAGYENADEAEKTQEDVSNGGENESVMPPPADEKHKVVAQLDEVTKESEEKASEILEIISSVSDEMEGVKNEIADFSTFLEEEKEIFEKLHEKFPDIKLFEKNLLKIEDKIERTDEVSQNIENMQNTLFDVLEIMQYQDIHRQKIERVINIMRALIKYMNRLFEGKIEDENRVQSANHISGDSNETVSDDEIEKLLQEFGG